MLLGYERDLSFFELRLTSLPNKSNILFNISEDIIPNLKKAAEGGTAVYNFKNDTATLHVHKVAIDQGRNVATILLHYSDSNLSDPAFKNMKSGVVRVAGKTQGEGIAVSAHLLIDLDNFKGQRSSVHLAVLEEVPGVSKSLIEKGMTALFNKIIARPNWIKRREGKTALKVRPKFSLNELAAESLKDGLKTRRLTGLKLIEKKSRDNFDESDLLPKEKSIGFSIGSNLSEEAKENLIYRVSKKAKDQGYSVLKVTYKDTYSGTKTGTFNSLEKEVLERAKGVFSKREKVYVESQILQCQEEIHAGIVTKAMIKLCEEGGKEYADSDSSEDLEASLVPQY